MSQPAPIPYFLYDIYHQCPCSVTHIFRVWRKDKTKYKIFGTVWRLGVQSVYSDCTVSVQFSLWRGRDTPSFTTSVGWESAPWVVGCQHCCQIGIRWMDVQWDVTWVRISPRYNSQYRTIISISYQSLQSEFKYQNSGQILNRKV